MDSAHNTNTNRNKAILEIIEPRYFETAPITREIDSNKIRGAIESEIISQNSLLNKSYENVFAAIDSIPKKNDIKKSTTEIHVAK